jgi:hypothetical protein
MSNFFGRDSSRMNTTDAKINTLKNEVITYSYYFIVDIYIELLHTLFL